MVLSPEAIVQSLIVLLVMFGLNRQGATNRKLSETQNETAKLLGVLKQQLEDHEKHCELKERAHAAHHAETKEMNQERFEGIWRKLEKVGHEKS